MKSNYFVTTEITFFQQMAGILYPNYYEMKVNVKSYIQVVEMHKVKSYRKDKYECYFITWECSDSMSKAS